MEAVGSLLAFRRLSFFHVIFHQFFKLRIIVRAYGSRAIHRDHYGLSAGAWTFQNLIFAQKLGVLAENGVLVA